MLLAKDLGKYLGMATIHGRVNQHTFAHIFNKINKQLASWRSKSLSMAERATIMQSSKLTILYYATQMANLARSLCDVIDRKARCIL